MTEDELWRKKKTVIVHTASDVWDAAAAVRAELKDPRFSETTETAEGGEFSAWFRHNQWTLGVKVQIRVTRSRGGSEVSVQCFPEWFTNNKAVALYRTELLAFATAVRTANIRTEEQAAA